MGVAGRGFSVSRGAAQHGRYRHAAACVSRSGDGVERGELASCGEGARRSQVDGRTSRRGRVAVVAHGVAGRRHLRLGGRLGLLRVLLLRARRR